MRPIKVFQILNILFYIFLAAPLLIVILTSFSDSSYLVFPPKGFTLSWYEHVFTDGRYLQPFINSLIVAIVSTGFALVLGIMISLAIKRYDFKFKGLISSLFLSPLIVPTLLLGIGLLILFSNLGVTNAYVRLILAHTVLTIPYVIRAVSAGLSKLNPSVEEASRVLGASPFLTTFLVTLPLIRPALISGAFFGFIISFDELVVALFLTSSNVVTLPILIYSDIQFNLDPSISAISSVLIIGTVILGLISMKFIDKKSFFG
ncbi:ABC transporter permease [Bacillus norwichensis]|uniref:ABC transporter permease n=1 Tax=Bacillus norwichensis TaxID=2762217 RepID=A0ABR8VQ10_9BACI|nr:ABC transporter permease [Bacillus norwichensis]MBD8006856.1 ABC transporter permease [Bacillus norwichensis]